jgi:triacylglycerol lipase
MSGVAYKVVGLLDGPAESSVYSTLDGPIESLSFLRRSLLFAELANISYLSRAEAGLLAHRMGFPEIRYYDRDGAQAYIFANADDAVVTCRGTEPNDWNDVKADLDLAKAVAETAGWVHRGFKREVDELWPRLEQALVNNTRTLWFCGHSLGAAMAAICAGRCRLSYIRSNPRALFTYGSPRVGNKRYVNYCQMEAYRWVNNNDIVTRVPPNWLGYRHKGEEVYLNVHGKIRKLTTWQRIKDRWRGFIRGVREGRVDFFDDHSISQYVLHIRGALEEEEGITLRPMTASTPMKQFVPYVRRRAA